jgi:hypothetical protein
MKTYLMMAVAPLALGLALALPSGCSSSPPGAGLWSCFDTGSGTGCVKTSALSTADRDVNGDGVADHFVCADDDDDGHDRTRDKDQSGRLTGTGTDADHDGVDDDLDCDHRDACESLSSDANPGRHEAGESEAGHDGSDDDGGSHGGSDSGGNGCEMHAEETCSPPTV